MTQATAARTLLLANNVLQEHNDAQLIFVEDYTFKTPSGASHVVYGRSSNGWIEWKNENGSTLHDAKRSGDETDGE